MLADAVALLRRVPFLAGVDDAEIDSIAACLSREEFAVGDTIAVPGAPLSRGGRGSLRFLASGRVELTPAGGRGASARSVVLSAGDHWGEMELFHPDAPASVARATEAASLYRWDRADLLDYLRRHPDVLRRLRFLAATRALALRSRLDWLSAEETLVAMTRRHPFFLGLSLIAPTLLAVAGGALLAGVAGTAGIFSWLGAGFIVAGLAWGFWNWLDWTNDYYLLTNRRAVWLEKIIALYDSRRETPLSMVLSVDLSTDVVGRWLGFGDVRIRTYTGQLLLRGVGQPATMAALVEESWRRSREKNEREDRAEISAALRHALRPPGSVPSSSPNAVSAARATGTAAPESAGASTAESAGRISPAAPAGASTADSAGTSTADSAGTRTATRAGVPPGSLGLDRWTFQTRFEDKGVITYRKHWAVLVGSLGAPSLLILIVVGLLGAQIGGLISGPPPGTALGVAAGLLIPLAGWWTYRYVDWANDIYQVTPDQIRDIYKKPLGREIRKVAPLENILGTEVDRKGLNGLLLNYGDVIANIGQSQFTFHGVYDPNGVQQDIVRALEAYLSRKKQTHRQERQEEMVEWLSSYHEESSALPGGNQPPTGTQGPRGAPPAAPPADPTFS